jgi:hypothetical protein
MSSTPRFCRLLALLAVTAMLGWACSGSNHQPGNSLRNPGFEEGPDGWAALTTEAWEPHFDVSETAAHSGTHAAYLAMRTDASTPATRIWGVAQEVSPGAFPEELKGFYRVDNWQRGTGNQYLQAVVIVFGATNRPDGFPNHQIRYILAGIEAPPFSIANARYIFLGPPEPVQGQWIEFQRNVAEDFRQQWGDVPTGFSTVRLLFEVRFDNKGSDERPSADVYYDDLYFGSATGAEETAP